MEPTDRPVLRSRAWPIASGLLLVLLLVLATVGTSPPLGAIVVTAVIVLCAAAIVVWALVRTRRQRRRYEDELTAWAAERATHAERLRIARDLHDLASHGLGLVTVRAAAARTLTGPAGDAERIAALADIEHAGREATTELRRMLAVLRRPGDDTSLRPAESLADLPRIVELARTSGVRAELTVDGERFAGGGVEAVLGRSAEDMRGGGAEEAPGRGAEEAPDRGAEEAPDRGAEEAPDRGAEEAPDRGAEEAPDRGAEEAPDRGAEEAPGRGAKEAQGGGVVEEVPGGGADAVLGGGVEEVSGGVQLTVCAVVREALANTARHAGPTGAAVVVRREGDAILVSVTDDGAGAGWVPHPGGGAGLAGLRERVGALGGTLEAGPRRGRPGFEVVARLPDSR